MATIALAAIGGLLTWVIAVPLADVELTVRSGASDRQIGAGAVVVVAILVGLAATGLAVLLGRSASHPRRTWLMLAVAALIVSLAGPLGATSARAGATLAALHLVVGVTLIVGIGGTLTPEQSRTFETQDSKSEIGR